MAEVKEKDLKGMSMMVPNQLMFVLKKTAAFQSQTLQDAVSRMAYKMSLEYLEQNGLLDIVKKLYREQELEEWDNELIKE